MDATLINPERVSRADLVVGIPSLNEADSIANVTRQVDGGLRTFFPDLRAVIINVDNASEDGTRDAFLATETRTPKAYVSTPVGVRGKGNNVRNLLRSVVELGARAGVMVDADLQTISPSWIRYLAEPVLLEGHDLVTPLYVRHKYDGTITNHIAYPLVRSVFGLRLRQPIGGDFGFSGTLASSLLSEPTWNDQTAHFGIDIWMTVSAIARRHKVCQAFLGAPKGHRPKDPSADLGPMFTQVVSTLFDLIGFFDHHWQMVEHSKPSAVFGFGLGAASEVDPIVLNHEALLTSIHRGRDHLPMWRERLSAETVEGLAACVAMEEPSGMKMATRFWARTLYDCAVAYHADEEIREELIRSIVPIYHARVLAFANRTGEMALYDAEEYLENVTRTFSQERGYLKDRWLEVGNGRHIFRESVAA